VGALADKIRKAVRDEQYVFGAHADQRLRERRIVGWQVVEGLDTASLIREREDATPNSSAEFDQILPDGTSFKAIWSWIEEDEVAKLVMMHFYDR
jgi:hypothetical protein